MCICKCVRVCICLFTSVCVGVCVCVQAAFFTRSIYELIGVDFIFDLYTKPKHFAFPLGRRISPPLFKARLPPLHTPHTHTHTDTSCSSNSHHCILNDASTSFIVYKQQLGPGKFDGKHDVCRVDDGSSRVDSLSPASSPLNYICICVCVCMYVSAYAVTVYATRPPTSAERRLPTPLMERTLPARLDTASGA